MAKPTQRAAKRSPKPARSTNRAKAKPPVKAAPKKAPAKKPVSRKPAAKKAAPKKAAPKKAAPKRSPATKQQVAKRAHPAAKPARKVVPPKIVKAAVRKPVAQHPVHAAPPARHAHPHPHRAAPAHRPAHGASGGGVAARLSVAAADEQSITREDGRYALPATVNIDLPKGYHPRVDEEYMCPRQLAYFRQKLRDWRSQLVEESRQTIDNLREEVRDVGDDAERATRETENSLELRTRDRYRKLIAKIEQALRKIEAGRYGYCEETDDEIGLERLEARPIATLSLDAQERREHLQKQMGD